MELVFVDFVKDQYINFYFRIDRFEGDPKIMEPNKCDELIWVDPMNLPSNIVANGKKILAKIAKGGIYTEFENF